jgi:hypothetical protein
MLTEMEAARAELNGALAPTAADVRPWQLDNRRLAEIITAIWEHERRTRQLSTGPRPHDTDLYRRLRQIIGGRGEGRR